MKVCPKCGTNNSDDAKFCSQCGESLLSAAGPIPPSPSPMPPPGVIPTPVPSSQESPEADIMFVLDCTGSMAGELNGIRDTILEFTENLKKEGARGRVGLIAFRDRLIGEEPQVLNFASGPFTADPDEFRKQALTLEPKGGGDAPESSMDAVMLALKQPFRDEPVKKVIVLVTDAPPLIPDKDTKTMDEVANKVREVGIFRFFIVTYPSDPAYQIYLKLIEASVGMIFELGMGDANDRKQDFIKTLKHLVKLTSHALKTH